MAVTKRNSSTRPMRSAQSRSAQSRSTNPGTTGVATRGQSQPTFWDRITGQGVGARQPVNGNSVGREVLGGPSNINITTPRFTADDYAASLTPGASVLGAPVGSQTPSTVFDWTPAMRPGQVNTPGSPMSRDWYDLVTGWTPGQGGSLGAGDQIVGTFQDLVKGWSENDIYDFMNGMGISPLRPDALSELVNKVVDENDLGDLSPEQQAQAVSKYLKLQARDYGPVQSVGNNLSTDPFAGLSDKALELMFGGGQTPDMYTLPMDTGTGTAAFNQSLEDLFNVPSIFY